MVRKIERLYYSLKDYLKDKYQKRVQKITVALPFTCPNIDGTKATGGCTYCFSGTRPAHLEPYVPLRRQIEDGMKRAKNRYGENILFFVYFQSYSNTYGQYDYLKSVYDTVLSFEEVVGIDVGTRPDCAPEWVLDLLESYTQKGLEVWVEYGLQSANFSTLRAINRAHGVSDFVDAVLRTKRRNIKVCAHIILGLPGEDREDMIETAKLLSSLPVDGVKIHPLHVIKNTKMAEQYLRGEFKVLSLQEYAERVVDVIEVLPPQMVIHRLTGEVEPERLIAPDYCTYAKKHEVVKAIADQLTARGSYQGCKIPFNR
ncbi:MAG: TIGR01212 family radical SAM protein [Aquificaceae bacterium]|nr:TIGR01212 family radical SAM protein [Aquificaceae bacterium]MDW8434226.1 TIGR01212 family radical SAM protein [Aquificaceae bacterium]